VNQDAIKKEDDELAEAEKQAEADNKQKHEELLRTLEKHKEEQKKLLQEQKQILEELKEHKKDIEQAAAKQRNDDNIPQGPPGKMQDDDTGVTPQGKSNENNQFVGDKQSPENVVQNVPSPESGVPVIKALENKNNIVNDTKNPESEVAQEQNKVENKDLLPQPMKFESAQKIPAGPKPNHVDEIQQGPMNLIQQGRSNVSSPNKSKAEVSGPILQQAQGL
jgi:hypothetical protein